MGLFDIGGGLAKLPSAFSGAEVLPVLSTLSPDIDGDVRKAALRAGRFFRPNVTA
jgi:hypothetical protein